jgi:hypothetical protein
VREQATSLAEHRLDYPYSLQSGVLAHTPIQQQAWWIAVLSVSPNYREVKVVEDGQVLAQLSYYLRQTRLGFNWGRNADWTNAGGLIVSESLAPGRRDEVLHELIGQLQRNISFYFSCNYDPLLSKDLVTAFRRHGFKHHREATYMVFPQEPNVLSRMKPKSRSQLKSAARTLAVEEISAHEFVQFYEENLLSKGERSVRPLSLARKLIEAAVARGSGRICAVKRINCPRDGGLVERNVSNQYDAAVACIWDEERYYYWMSTHRSHSANNSGIKAHKDAVKVLMLEAMAHAKRLRLVFDTDGVSSPGMEHLYKDLLRLERFEARDVFLRTTRLAGLYEKTRSLFLRTARAADTAIVRKLA